MTEKEFQKRLEHAINSKKGSTFEERLKLFHMKDEEEYICFKCKKNWFEYAKNVFKPDKKIFISCDCENIIDIQ